MDDRLRERVQGFVEQLLKEEKFSLRKSEVDPDFRARGLDGKECLGW